MAEQQGYADNNHLDKSLPDKRDVENHAGDSLHSTDVLSKAVFFHPQIPGFPPPLSDEQIQKLEQSGITTVLPKIRQKYQVVLAACLREQHREQQLQVMARIFAKLQNLCWDAPLSPLWESCIALVEGLQNGSIQQTLPITNLLRSVDLQLRAFILKGPSFINTTPDEQLFRGLLYVIAQSQSEADGSFGSALKVRYKLHDALNSSEANTFVGNEAASRVIRALNYELADIRNALELYLMAIEPDPLPLQNQLPIIQQVSDTLVMLGLEEKGQQVLHYKQQLHNIIETGNSSQNSNAETALITIATGLLKLETVLHQLVSGEPADSTALPDEATACNPEPAESSIATFNSNSLTLVEIDQDTRNTGTPNHSSDVIDEPAAEPPEPAPDLPATIPETLSEALSKTETGLIDEDLLKVFREEASDVQEQLASLIPRWQSSAGRQLEILTDIRRAFHNLKGSGRMVEANIIGELAWSIENMLNRLIEGTTAFTPEMLNLVARANGMLPALLDDYIHDNQLLTPDVLVCMEMADALAIGEQYSAPEHPDAPEADDDNSIAVQFGEIINDQPLQRLLPGEGLEHLLLANTWPELWQQGIDHSQLTLLQQDLDTLGQRCREQQLQPVAELSDILKDICSYLGSHTHTLPGPLVTPLTNGFNTLLNILNQTTEQQAPEPPQAIFTELRHALEALLLNEESEEYEEPVKTTAVNQVQHNIEVEEIELLDLLLDEAFEISEDTHQALEDWVKETSNPEPVKEIQRLLHSLKAGARMSEQHDLADFSHALEGVYRLIASLQFSKEKWTADIPLGLMQASHDRIDQILHALKTDQPVPDALIYIQKLNEWQAQNQSTPDNKPEPLTTEPEWLTTGEAHHLPDYLAQPSAGEPQSDNTEHTPVSRQLKQNREAVQVSAELFAELINLSHESGINHSRIEQQVIAIRHTLDAMETTVTRITEQLRQLDMETRPQLTRPLLESASDLADLGLAIVKKSSESESLLIRQSGTQIQLQDKLLQARMVSFSSLLPELEKITARISDELGKPVKLNVQNAEGKMDRTMLDRILSPLEYLIRNIISYGIEDADDRRATGKPEVGQLELVVKREAADIVLELHDDGEGIDAGAVQSKAVEMRLLAPDDQLPDTDLIQLIIEPGFASAHDVGLHRVNAELRQMGGSMQIESTRGKGCCFRLRLPFTLLMSRALVVRAGEYLYALPLQSITGVITIAANALLSCFQEALPLEYGGEQFQVLALGQLAGHATPGIQEASCHMVLLDRGGQKYALQIDELIGNRDIISKNPGPQFASLSGVTGATILADGRVAIVIDPAALIRKFRVNQYYRQ